MSAAAASKQPVDELALVCDRIDATLLQMGALLDLVDESRANLREARLALRSHHERNLMMPVAGGAHG